MKNLLKIGADILLILFFIIILLVPVLVALNLDPKLYQKNHPDIAGITSREDKEVFGIETSSIKNMYERGLIVRQKQSTKNNYIFKFDIPKGSKIDQTIELGKIFNTTNGNLNLRVNVYESETHNLNDLKLNFKTGDNYHILKKDEPCYFEVQTENETLILDIKSNTFINYNREFEIHLNLTNPSIIL